MQLIENAEEPANEKELNESVFDFREIFDKYLDKGLKKPKKKRKHSDSTESLNRNEILKENIDKLKKMQEKSDDKEV